MEKRGCVSSARRWKFRGMSREREQTFRDRDRDRFFPASLTLFLALPPPSWAHTPTLAPENAAVPLASVHSGLSGDGGSGAAAATGAGHIFDFQFNHTPGHELSGNNYFCTTSTFCS